MVARLRSLYAFALFSSYAVSLCFEVLLSPCFPLGAVRLSRLSHVQRNGVSLTSLMGKRNTPRSGTHPRASFALLSRFYATLFLSLSICLSIPKKTLLVLLRPTVIVNIPRSESARTRLTSRLQLSRSGFRLGLLVLNHTNRKRYSRPPKNRLF
jgi:hypothetical protein